MGVTEDFRSKQSGIAKPHAITCRQPRWRIYSVRLECGVLGTKRRQVCTSAVGLITLGGESAYFRGMVVASRGKISSLAARAKCRASPTGPGGLGKCLATRRGCHVSPPPFVRQRLGWVLVGNEGVRCRWGFVPRPQTGGPESLWKGSAGETSFGGMTGTLPDL